MGAQEDGKLPRILLKMKAGATSPLDDTIRREMLAHLPRLRRFAHGLTGSSDEGDDLLQATCERAIRKIDTWTPGTRLDSWMFRIARNIYLNELRARKTRREYAADVSHRSHEALDGEQLLMSQLTYTAVRDIVTALPEEQRSVLLLIAAEGLTYSEASEVLEVPIGTVTSRLARARALLKRRIDGPPAKTSQGLSEMKA